MNAPFPMPKPWDDLHPDEKEKIVFPLIEAGKSYSQIASLVGAASRNSIARVVSRARYFKHEVPRALNGKQRGGRPKKSVSILANRKQGGILGGKPSRALREARKARLNLNRTNYLHSVEKRKSDPGLPESIAASEAWTVPPSCQPVSLMELTSRTCRWPLGDPRDEDFGFCGAETVPTKPYCEYHTRIAWVPLRRRKEP